MTELTIDAFLALPKEGVDAWHTNLSGVRIGCMSVSARQASGLWQWRVGIVSQPTIEHTPLQESSKDTLCSVGSSVLIPERSLCRIRGLVPVLGKGCLMLSRSNRLLVPGLRAVLVMGCHAVDRVLVTREHWHGHALRFRWIRFEILLLKAHEVILLLVEVSIFPVASGKPRIARTTSIAPVNLSRLTFKA